MASRVSDFYQYTALINRLITLRNRKSELNSKILQLGSLESMMKGLSQHAAHSVLVPINRFCYVHALLLPNDMMVRHGNLRAFLSFNQLKTYMTSSSKAYEDEYRRCLLEIEQIEQRIQIMNDYGVKEIIQIDENSFTIKHNTLVEIVELSQTPYQQAKRVCRFKTAEERDAYLKSAQKKKKKP